MLGLSTLVGLVWGFGCSLGWVFLGSLGISIREGWWDVNERCARAAEDQALSFTVAAAIGTTCDGLSGLGTCRIPLSDPNVSHRFLSSPPPESQLGKVWALLFKPVVQALKGKPGNPRWL